MICRICKNKTTELLDLGSMPPANSLLEPDAQSKLEKYPLVLDFCDSCFNLPLRDCLGADDLYSHYLYTTPKSSILKEHYSKLISFLVENDYLTLDTNLLEIGSNSGEFLKVVKPFVKNVLGVDPATDVANKANDNGIKTIVDFFGADSIPNISRLMPKPDLIIGRHSLAHNCDAHELMSSAYELLAEDGVLVIENAYALDTITNTEFDQIYHEHMFYYSLRSLEELLSKSSMHLINCMESPIHGGSMIFVAAKKSSGHYYSDRLLKSKRNESLLFTSERIRQFANDSIELSLQLKSLLKKLRAEGKVVYCYGATAKGSTLINFSKITKEEVKCCIDSTPEKQGKVMAGSEIPIFNEQFAIENPPDFFLLTAWNYKDEIIKKYRENSSCNAKFIVPIPNLDIL